MNRKRKPLSFLLIPEEALDNVEAYVDNLMVSYTFSVSLGETMQVFWMAERVTLASWLDPHIIGSVNIDREETAISSAASGKAIVIRLTLEEAIEKASYMAKHQAENAYLNHAKEQILQDRWNRALNASTVSDDAEL